MIRINYIEYVANTLGKREDTYVSSRSETHALFLQFKIAALEITELH